MVVNELVEKKGADLNLKSGFGVAADEAALKNNYDESHAFFKEKRNVKMLP